MLDVYELKLKMYLFDAFFMKYAHNEQVMNLLKAEIEEARDVFSVFMRQAADSSMLGRAANDPLGRRVVGLVRKGANLYYKFDAGRDKRCELDKLLAAVHVVGVDTKLDSAMLDNMFARYLAGMTENYVNNCMTGDSSYQLIDMMEVTYDKEHVHFDGVDISVRDIVASVGRNSEYAIRDDALCSVAHTCPKSNV